MTDSDSTDQTTDDSTDADDFPLPNEVDHHAPGIFRVDVESLFGHIDDPEKRLREVERYVDDLREELPEGSTILPTEIEKVGHAGDADELVTRSEVQEMIEDALEPTRSEVRETIEDAMVKARIETLKQLSESVDDDSDIHPALREYTTSETGAVVNVVDEDED